MYCCDLLSDAVERGAMYYGAKTASMTAGSSTTWIPSIFSVQPPAGATTTSASTIAPSVVAPFPTACGWRKRKSSLGWPLGTQGHPNYGSKRISFRRSRGNEKSKTSSVPGSYRSVMPRRRASAGRSVGIRNLPSSTCPLRRVSFSRLP